MRKQDRYDALIPSGDYSEDEQPTYSPTWLWWDRRIAEIAEQLGQAQAHAIRRPALQFKSRDDGELMEETVFARRSLERQRKRDHLDVDALRTAAFAYQLVLNVSHERALASDETQSPGSIPSSSPHRRTQAMRTLPPHKMMVKSRDHSSEWPCYDVVLTSDGKEELAGQVMRVNGRPSIWAAYVLATEGDYGSGLRAKGHHKLRSAAAEGVVVAWVQQLDEIEAHRIAVDIAAGTAMAERHAREQISQSVTHRLTPTQYRTSPFSVSSRVVASDLLTEQNDLRNRLKGLKPDESYYLRHNAYMIRMRELELERRQTIANLPVRLRLAVQRTRCEANASKGTGQGICDAVLDEHGTCPNAGHHVEEE